MRQSPCRACEGALMLGRLKLLAPFTVALAIAGCNAGGPSVPVMTEQYASQSYPAPQWQLLILNKSPQDKELGWGARDIEAAYNLPSSSKGSGQIVAIVDAYDNPNVASDLAMYRRHYGLPKAKLYKYNEDGQQSHYPKGNMSWGKEIDLDVEMVSASCPNCTIYLIEANTFDIANLDKAE